MTIAVSLPRPVARITCHATRYAALPAKTFSPFSLNSVSPRPCSRDYWRKKRDIVRLDATKKKKVIFRERKSEDRWKNYCNYRARLCTGLRLIFSTFVQRIDRSFESRLTRVKLWYSFFHTNLAFSPSFFLFLGKIDLCIHIYRFN